MKKLILALALMALTCVAQKSGTPVQVVNYPHDSPTQLLFYDGSSNLIYVCYAAPTQNYAAYTGSNQLTNYQWTFAGSTLTSIVVSSNVGTVTASTNHGLQIGNKVIVSGSVTTALNGTYYIQTVPSATTFTITTSGVANATYTTGLVVATNAPLSSLPLWAIQKLTYTGSNLATLQWSNGSAAAMNQICDNRATTTGTTMITYQ